MAISIYQPPSMSDAKTTECNACACPTCGGLECLCRPRFFAGQLLTDETLNSLEHYIIEKNKLHNRYLHGWGVVCGLEVVCNPCDAVTVRGGYALSPCGDDIIVCRDVQVDVCGLINTCKDKRREWECEPYAAGQESDCRDAPETWILTVRYDEKTSRGITALKGSSAPACCSSCSCGGSSSCGCGCHGQNGNGGSQKQAYAASSVTTSRQAHKSVAVASQCEPTVTCEGYVFEVCKAPPEDKDFSILTYLKSTTRSQGALVDRAQACLLRFATGFPQPGANPSKAELYQWCCAVKRRLRDELFDHPVYNCQLAKMLNFPCPDPNKFADASAYQTAVTEAMSEVFAVFAADYVQYCLCSAFLPPCPEEVCDPRVPLATVTVRKDQNGACKVVRVCNLGKRRHVITFRNLGYWFSFILTPMMVIVRYLLERICCKPFYQEEKYSNYNLPGAQSADSTQPPGPAPSSASDKPPDSAKDAGSDKTAAAEKATAGQPPVSEVLAASSVTDKRGFKAFAGRVWENRTRTVSEETLFMGAIGAKDAKGMPYLSETELKNPFYTLMVNRMAGPLLAKLPDETPGALKGAGANLVVGSFRQKAEASPDATAAAPEPDEINQLKTNVADLQSTVARQSEMIDELKKLVKKGK